MARRLRQTQIFIYLAHNDSAFASPFGQSRRETGHYSYDVGREDASEPDAIFALPSQMTVAILPNHPRSTEIANEEHDRGYEVMLHLPMESEANESPESQQLGTGMSKSEEFSVKCSAPFRDGVRCNVPFSMMFNSSPTFGSYSNTQFAEPKKRAKQS